tara:strand:- start:260 stop:457 length:198 start_codon:yes stop_codon:yes gene_type:complete
MTWLEIFGWFLAFTAVSGLFYRKGVKAGIKHSLITLNLDTHQIDKLNTELEQDSHDLAMKTYKLN